MRRLLSIAFLLVPILLVAQIGPIRKTQNDEGSFRDFQDQGEGQSISNTILEFERPPVEDYKIITVARDTTYVDTTLNINKDYKFNFLRKDRYGLLPFANTGQAHNKLIRNFDTRSTMPLDIATARHQAYMEVEDINYYYIPTPLTELFYRSAFEQGQQLDAFFSMNIHPRLNFSIAYKGVRSLGKYQNALTSTGNFRFATSYRTKNDRYHVKAHWVAQDLLNQENGGLTDIALEQFANNDEDADDRSLLAVQFEDAESILDGNRIYVNHFYNLVQKKDSLKDYSLRVGHIFNTEDKFFRYEQESAQEIYGDAFQQGSFVNRTDYEETYNEFNAIYEDVKLGQLKFQANATNYDYGYNTVVIRDEDGDGVSERIPNRLQGAIIAVGGGYENRIGEFDIKGEVQVNVVGDFDGYNIYGEMGYTIGMGNRISASILSNSRQAAFNHLLFQSNYTSYNWYNELKYNTVKTNTIAGRLSSDKFFDIDLSASTIKDHAYFGLDPISNQVNSLQASESLNHLKVTAHKNVGLGKFSLDLTATYQNVSGAEGVLNVPDAVGRGSFYFTDRLFKKALFLQTGITANYFTKYHLDGYNPILAEFFTQNTQEFGEFPLLDFFVNLKVRQTRIFLKAEHFNSSFTGNNFYSAPGYVYRDFNVRFGIVWNFFL